MFRFHESGIITHWADHIPTENADAMRKIFRDDNQIRSHHHPLALTMDNLSGAFWLMVIGLCGSILIFLVEYCGISRKSKRV